MGHIKEPANIDLELGPMPLSDEDRQAISAIIAHYKSTGEIPKAVRKAKVGRKEDTVTTTGPKRNTPDKSSPIKKRVTISKSDK